MANPAFHAQIPFVPTFRDGADAGRHPSRIPLIPLSERDINILISPKPEALRSTATGLKAHCEQEMEPCYGTWTPCSSSRRVASPRPEAEAATHKSQRGAFLVMQPPGPGLKQQVLVFYDVLLDMALFNEAHCLGIAITSPSLCDGAYVGTYLEQAAVAARKCGFCDVSDWITSCMRPSAHGAPRRTHEACSASVLRFRRKSIHSARKSCV
jgi:hypothetical protein